MDKLLQEVLRNEFLAKARTESKLREEEKAQYWHFYRHGHDGPFLVIANFVFSDGNLIILIHGGGEIILQGFGSEAAGNAIPPLNFAGDIIGAFDLLSQTASAEQLAEIQPAAGPGAGVNLVGPASFSPFAPLPLPPSIPSSSFLGTL